MSKIIIVDWRKWNAKVVLCYLSLVQCPAEVTNQEGILWGKLGENYTALRSLKSDIITCCGNRYALVTSLTWSRKISGHHTKLKTGWLKILILASDARVTDLHEIHKLFLWNYKRIIIREPFNQQNPLHIWNSRFCLKIKFLS